MTKFQFMVAYKGKTRPLAIHVMADNFDAAFAKVRRMYPQHQVDFVPGPNPNPAPPLAPAT